MSKMRIDQVVAETSHLRLVQRNSWDFVQRTNATGVVIVVAVTDTRRVLLVEQYRPPVDARVIEFPAGLVGDVSAEESLEEAARRELLEETGYSAWQLEKVFVGPSSAGLTDEVVTFFIAGNLQKTGPGGGKEREEITVHQVALADVDRWLEERMAAGVQVGSRVLAGLYLLKRSLEARA